MFNFRYVGDPEIRPHTGGQAGVVRGDVRLCGARLRLHVSISLAGLFVLFLGTLAAAIVQYGDHIYLAEQGVMYENRLLSLFGKRGRWMRWEDIVEVREIRQKVLILLSRDGRRMLVDAILGYPIARYEIRSEERRVGKECRSRW